MASSSTGVATPSSSSRNKARGRPRAWPSASTPRNMSDPSASRGSGDPPPKKRKYVPGGPGGGGRYIEIDGSETPVGGTGPGGYAYSGPRARVGRERSTHRLASATTPTPATLRRREPTIATPSYSSAAAVAAAVVHGDGHKPREERGWEELHPNLDVEAKFAIYSAEEVDGTQAAVTAPSSSMAQLSLNQAHSPLPSAGNGDAMEGIETSASSSTPALNGSQAEPPPQPDDDDASGIVFSQPKKRRVGRPSRRAEKAPERATSPVTPKVVPPPGPNPHEKLTLPRPTFRRIDPFRSFEQKSAGQIRYVDRSMANVGYQETDFYARPEQRFIRLADGAFEEDLDLVPGLTEDGDKSSNALGGSGVGRVEYDMDEQDDEWLAAYNDLRRSLEVEPITREVFEITMTKIEKEWYALEKRIPKPNPKPPQTQRPRSGSAAAVNGEAPGAAGEDQDSRCAICDDGDCENTNAIVFCDGCDLAVHQDCYGVPFIPEGQWLCRKCQLIGRATPTCIFCPNTDGAFKQTNASRWSHLLCAIWIPEVSLGNPTFMEPVMDVEKVPKQRWKLTCYICRQKMGACIQCSNKNCFVAFHVICARRARLFLKMKSPHGGPAHADPSVLKAYCDKHVPADWRRENDVDAAFADAQEFYHHEMRGRIWADSQQSALAITSGPSQGTSTAPDEILSPTPRIHLTVGGNKRKSNQRPRIVWKLPSGAPVIPQVVYNTVETSLQRFMIRKRKEYVAEACKYWTLKRESRRGAALLKRLQLQMETFSSMEVTRRNYTGMGAAGRVRLQRRIDFATNLLQDLGRLRDLCQLVKTREQEKFQDAELLKEVVDTVYCPISALLWPILERAQSLDGKGVFRDGFARLRSMLETRSYTTVAAFSEDFGVVFSSVIGSEAVADVINAKTQGDVAPEDTTSAPVTLTAEQKDLRRLAKRIIKAVQPSLEGAIRSEAELGGRPFEKELRELEMFLNHGILSRRNSTAASLGDPIELDPANPNSCSAGENVVTQSLNGQIVVQLAGTDGDLLDKAASGNSTLEGQMTETVHVGTSNGSHERGPGNVPNGISEQKIESGGTTTGGEHGHLTTTTSTTTQVIMQVAPPAYRALQPTIPPTPPLSSADDLLAPLLYGGIPWYMEPFDPVGTTIQEERWTGREVVRGMSEELSELDDEELEGLVDEEDMDGYNPIETDNNNNAAVATIIDQNSATEATSPAIAASAAAGAAENSANAASPTATPKKKGKGNAGGGGGSRKARSGRKWR